MKPSIFFGLLVIAHGAFGQEQHSAASLNLREVRGQTIVSRALPHADLTFARHFRYVGSQQVNLYGNAEAEQYLFVTAGRDGMVKRFYWIQFEHFLPTNSRTYDYAPDRTTRIGGMTFIYDVKSWPNYSSMQVEDPQSDGAAVERLLAKHGLSFPQKVVRVRMFHLPTADHRTELMVIYGEALSDKSNIPVRENGVELDKESPALANDILEHARQNVDVNIR